MATPNSALPVWTIRPNWKEGITERLEWLTDVLAADDGSEQTRSLRLSPRRGFEMTFNPWDEDRSYFELWLHRLADDEFMVPVWHDKARLTANVSSGATVIPFDNTNREFTVGGMCVLIGDNPHVFDARTIQSMTDTGITLSAGVSQSWLKGVAVYPLRRARLSDESRLAALTNRVGLATLAFELNQANDLASEGAWTGLSYEGLPVITSKPNYSEQLDLSFMRQVEMAESDHGLRHLARNSERAFTTQLHTFRANGRAEQMQLRQMLYRLRGRSQRAWLPTFNQDMRLARAAGAADTAINIRKIGYGYTGGVQGGREHILIGGAIPRRIASTGAPLATTEERLNLSAAVGESLPVGRTASFMDVCRLDQDAVEIVHHTDTEGVADCRAAFRSILNSRQAPAVLSYPVPVSAESSDLCGVEGDNECLSFVVFEGWYVELRLDYGINEKPYDTSPAWLTTRQGSGEQINYSGVGAGKIVEWNKPGCYWIIRYTNPASYAVQQQYLRLQFNSGGVPSGTRARLIGRKWDEQNYTTLVPKVGSWSTGDPFDVRGLWPDDWYFDF